MPTPTPPLALPALPELLHCPFCGCKAVWFKTGRDIGIECEDGFDCPGRAQTNVYAPEHRQTVIEEWNRRVDINGNDIRDAAAILSDRAGRGDAAGWVSVPREPTREMRLAGAFAPNHRTSEAVWRAMIAARPAAPTGEAS